MLLLFFRFLSLPGAGCWPCTCSGSAAADEDADDDDDDDDDDNDEGIDGGAGGGGDEATELMGDKLDVDEPRGEDNNVNVTIPAFAAAVSIMSYAGRWLNATDDDDGGRGGGGGGGGGGGEHELPAPPELCESSSNVRYWSGNSGLTF